MNNFESPAPKDDSCHVWFKSDHAFSRRRWNSYFFLQRAPSPTCYPPQGPIGATLGTAMNNFYSSPNKVSTHYITWYMPFHITYLLIMALNVQENAVFIHTFSKISLPWDTPSHTLPHSVASLPRFGPPVLKSWLRQCLRRFERETAGLRTELEPFWAWRCGSLELPGHVWLAHTQYAYIMEVPPPLPRSGPSIEYLWIVTFKPVHWHYSKSNYCSRK